MNHKTIMLANAFLLAQAMTACDVASIAVAYSGAGDEGNINDTSFLDPAGEPLEATDAIDECEVALLCSSTGALGDPMDLESAAEHLYEQVMSDAGVDGYHDNEGGFGCFTIKADGTFILDHNDYVVESVNSSFEYAAAPLPPGTGPHDQVTLAA